MSMDPKLLEAISKRVSASICYLDLVTLCLAQRQKVYDDGQDHALEDDGSRSLETRALSSTIGGIPFGNPRKAYFCVGHHAIFLMRSSLSHPLYGGHIEFQCIEKCLVDTGSRSRFVLILSSAGTAKEIPEKVLVDSEHRESLLSYLKEYYLADAMLRCGEMLHLPRFDQDLYSSVEPGSISPFAGYKLARYMDYQFFLRDEFRDEPHGISKVLTGTYCAPASVWDRSSQPVQSRSWMGAAIFGTEKQEDRSGPRLQFLINVVDAMQLSSLRPLGREHVRWVAMEYKQNLVRGRITVVLTNQAYHKKMNLSNDLAAWTCWELLLKDHEYTMALVVLRRQYMPPMLDTVQDFVLAIKCPASLIETKKVKVESLLQELHLAADSFGTQVQSPSIYTDMIQAKLDALLYDEDAYDWIRSRFKMWPSGKVEMEKYATIFVKGLVKMLHDNHVLKHASLLDDMEKLAVDVCTNIGERDMEPMVIALKVLNTPKEGLPRNAEEGSSEAAGLNAWHARVAAYLSHCVDGGLLGSTFSLADMILASQKPTISEEDNGKLDDILSFLLHVRPKDLRKRWELKSITSQLLSLGLLSTGGLKAENGSGSLQGELVECSFNDRMMQALLDTGHLRILLEGDGGSSCMSVEFACLIGNLLSGAAASVNLKASVCRLIIAEKDVGDQGQALILCQGLLQLMKRGGLFLATYACAALVNLSQSKEDVKGPLVHEGIFRLCLNNLQSNDRDLMLYTLMLLVHFTKRAHHREESMGIGLLEELVEILEGSLQETEVRRRVLTEMCSVLGQMCNDSSTREKIFKNKDWQVLQKLLEVHDHVVTHERTPGGDLTPDSLVKLMSKAMFAIRQLCVFSPESMEQAGESIIPNLMKDMSNAQNLTHLDWASNAVLLLKTLTVNRNNCKLIRHNNWEEAYGALLTSKLGSLDAMRDRIQQVAKMIVEFELREVG